VEDLEGFDQTDHQTGKMISLKPWKKTGSLIIKLIKHSDLISLNKHGTKLMGIPWQQFPLPL